jgi:dynactin complex subunit
LKVGDAVTWKRRAAVVRYVGAVECLGAGTWVGLQLGDDKGEHDGTLSGVQYYALPTKSGVFCRAAELTANIAKKAVNSATLTSRKIAALHVQVADEKQPSTARGITTAPAPAQQRTKSPDASRKPAVARTGRSPLRTHAEVK